MTINNEGQPCYDAASDEEAFADRRAAEDRLQDLDDADPTAPMKPAFPDPGTEYSDVDPDQSAERANEERGNRGPDEEPGFGQGA